MQQLFQHLSLIIAACLLFLGSPLDNQYVSAASLNLFLVWTLHDALWISVMLAPAPIQHQ